MSKDKILYSYDFVDTLNKKCIEYNGNYWHGNPEIYNENWINPHNKLSINEIRKKDKLKHEAIRERGYDILVIWEKEVDDNKIEVIQKCLDFLTL